MATRKMGVTGKYGVRYGRKTRERIKNVDSAVKATKECPQCGKKTIKRLSHGIYECKKCGKKTAGKAYTIK